MPHLSVPGAELAYETAGRVSAPALLLIPAGIATLRMWDQQVDALAEDHFVARYDPRCFGGTRHDEAVPFANRNDALALLDHLGVERATVVGASRGGTIALDLALDAPDRVAGVVTVCSSPSGFPDIPLPDEEQRRFDEVDAIDPAFEPLRLVQLETTLWAVGPLRTEADLDPGFVRRVHELNGPNVTHAADDGTVLPLEPPAYGRLRDIRSPALIMVGEYDISSALAEYEYQLDELHDATGYRFQDSAHLPSVERAAEFERVLLEWLGERGL
jgi:3-oxoadipate enol-lactonase